MAAIDTFGLIICGGRSSRMGIDKSRLIYHDKEQRYHIYEMLQPFFQNTILCCNDVQAAGIQTPYQYIIDKDEFKNIGPMGALLSAYDAFPEKNFVAVGCDYPFLTAATINNFINSIINKNSPSACYNQESGFYEPLLAYYTAENVAGIKELYAAGNYSLQKFLRQQHAFEFTDFELSEIKSVDTIEEMNAAQKQFSKT
jgi:molybdopterin-guanine dinucleotide biosynthesis protein A